MFNHSIFPKQGVFLFFFSTFKVKKKFVYIKAIIALRDEFQKVEKDKKERKNSKW